MELLFEEPNQSFLEPTFCICFTVLFHRQAAWTGPVIFVILLVNIFHSFIISAKGVIYVPIPSV